jgi:hypothetical protein
MTEDDKALAARLRDNGEFNDCAIWETMQEAADRIEAQAAEIERLREALVDVTYFADRNGVHIARAALEAKP